MAAGILTSGWVHNASYPFGGTPPQLIYSYKNPPVPPKGALVKIAGFALNGTLISPKSMATFPSEMDPTDWVWKEHDRPAILKHLHSIGYQIVIFGNEMGISTSFNPAARLQVHKTKVEAIAAALGIPIRFHLATKSDAYRLPSPDMLHHYEFVMNANGLEIDYQKSFFCGDAAGRGAKKGKKKDYARSDLEFAARTGLHFVFPETLSDSRFFKTLLPSLTLHAPIRPRDLSAFNAETWIRDNDRAIAAAGLVKDESETEDEDDDEEEEEDDPDASPPRRRVIPLDSSSDGVPSRAASPSQPSTNAVASSSTSAPRGRQLKTPFASSAHQSASGSGSSSSIVSKPSQSSPSKKRFIPAFDLSSDDDDGPSIQLGSRASSSYKGKERETFQRLPSTNSAFSSTYSSGSGGSGMFSRGGSASAGAAASGSGGGGEREGEGEGEGGEAGPPPVKKVRRSILDGLGDLLG
ncbi:polynucleotide kinase 3 phosphatase-domain-containing protein [Mrakia frigida]|uniref:polynucleotide kinase 3 phosphatase-domain-containing protein n=1 Tax=Mrakia frigida TaxID=29902 RepID=UPI003FCBFB0B